MAESHSQDPEMGWKVVLGRRKRKYAVKLDLKMKSSELAECQEKQKSGDYYRGMARCRVGARCPQKAAQSHQNAGAMRETSKNRREETPKCPEKASCGANVRKSGPRHEKGARCPGQETWRTHPNVERDQLSIAQVMQVQHCQETDQCRPVRSQTFFPSDKSYIADLFDQFPPVQQQLYGPGEDEDALDSLLSHVLSLSEANIAGYGEKRGNTVWQGSAKRFTHDDDPKKIEGDGAGMAPLLSVPEGKSKDPEWMEDSPNPDALPPTVGGSVLGDTIDPLQPQEKLEESAMEESSDEEEEEQNGADAPEHSEGRHRHKRVMALAGESGAHVEGSIVEFNSEDSEEEDTDDQTPGAKGGRMVRRIAKSRKKKVDEALRGNKERLEVLQKSAEEAAAEPGATVAMINFLQANVTIALDVHRAQEEMAELDGDCLEKLAVAFEMAAGDADEHFRDG